MQVTTIGLDIAKNVFQVHAIDTAEKVVVDRDAARWWSSSRRCQLAWLAWKPARRPIIGRVNSRSLATRYG